MSNDNLRRKPPRTLIFIADMVPTQEEYELATKIGFGAVFRNATYVDNENPGQLEKCDFVAGLVPKCYLASYPLHQVNKKTMPQPPAPPAPGAWGGAV